MHRGRTPFLGVLRTKEKTFWFQHGMPSIFRYETSDSWMKQIKRSIHYVSMFIHATLVIPRLLFAMRTDKSMAAKFGNGTIDVLYLRSKKGIELATKKRNWTGNEDFASWGNHNLRHQWFLRPPMHLSNTSSSYSRSVRTVSGDSHIVNELSAYIHLGTEARYLLALTWTSF